MHLTNYAINSKNKGKFIFNKSLDDMDVGHKRTYQFVLRYIEESFEDGADKVKKLQRQIDKLITKTICAVQPQLKNYMKSTSHYQSKD